MPHMLHLFNVFREYDGKENCAQVLEEEIRRILGMKYVNDEHDCNVVSTNSLNIHDANEDVNFCVSYKHVEFCVVYRIWMDTPNREDR